MSRLSTVAVSTFVPALNVLSTTLPESTFLSLVRTKAPPLPGLTCWNSTTDHNCPSRLSTRPFLRSFVVATMCLVLDVVVSVIAVPGHAAAPGRVGDRLTIVPAHGQGPVIGTARRYAPRGERSRRRRLPGRVAGPGPRPAGDRPGGPRLRRQPLRLGALRPAQAGHRRHRRRSGRRGPAGAAPSRGGAGRRLPDAEARRARCRVRRRRPRAARPRAPRPPLEPARWLGRRRRGHRGRGRSRGPRGARLPGGVRALLRVVRP